MMGRMNNCFNNFFRFTFFLGGPKSVIWPREMCRPQRLRDSFLSFCTLIALFFVVFKILLQTGELEKHEKLFGVYF